MSNQAFLRVKAAELQRLMETASEDPILAPQLKERLDEAPQDLQLAQKQEGRLLPKEDIPHPRAAIFLRGKGVVDSEGIRPSLAGEALIQYERMFTERALHDERVAARDAGRQRRRRGAPTPGLLFTGTPRGSFGLEFVPQATEDIAALLVHARSLENVADDLSSVAEGDAASIEQAVQNIPPRVLQPLKQFLKALAQHGAELRFAFPNRASRCLTAEQISNAAEQLERDVVQEITSVEGTFRGVTRDSLYFDLRTTEGHLITGIVDDGLSEEDLERIDALTNNPCVARLQRTTITKIGGAVTTTYVLLDATPTSSPPQPDS